MNELAEVPRVQSKNIATTICQELQSTVTLLSNSFRELSILQTTSFLDRNGGLHGAISAIRSELPILLKRMVTLSSMIHTQMEKEFN